MEQPAKNGGSVGRRAMAGAWHDSGAGSHRVNNSAAPRQANQWFFPDRNGNITLVTDGTDVVLESYRYDAFGMPTVYSGSGSPIGNSSAIGNRFTFTGREWRSRFGFYEYRARAYNPTLGRFMSEDPKGFDSGDYNLYRYCNNDPMDLTDPMGLELQVLLLRDDFVIGPGEKRADVARRQPGTYTIYDNGKLVFVGRANENGFQKNVEGKLTMGVKAGTYKLLPKGDSWGPGNPNTQPSITGSAPGLRAGQPNGSYGAPAEVHQAAPPNYGADSRACVTTSPFAVETTRGLMMRDQKNGDVSTIQIIDGHEVRKAIPVSTPRPTGQ